MSDERHTPSAQKGAEANKDTPTQSRKAYDAYAVRNDKEGKGHFHKIGAAFAHKDGEGYDIDMVAAPTNGRLTLRTPKDRLDATRSPSSKDRNTGARGQDHERE